jgi:hypothetical protein
MRWQKLRGWLDANPAKHATLQGLVRAEMAAGSTTASGSGTDALLWLKRWVRSFALVIWEAFFERDRCRCFWLTHHARALSFIRVFLAEFLKGQSDLTVAASTAYEATLRKYHNFIVRGIFSVSVFFHNWL